MARFKQTYRKSQGMVGNRKITLGTKAARSNSQNQTGGLAIKKTKYKKKYFKGPNNTEGLFILYQIIFNMYKY